MTSPSDFRPPQTWIGCFALLVFLLATGCHREMDRVPYAKLPDVELLRQFENQQEQVVRLKTLVREDARHRIVSASVEDSKSGPLPQDRLDRYKKLLNSIGAYSVRGDSDGIEIVLVMEGYLNAGYTKGLAWRSHPPKATIDSLSFKNSLPVEINSTCYRKISGDWYLFLFDAGRKRGWVVHGPCGTRHGITDRLVPCGTWSPSFLTICSLLASTRAG